LEVVGIFILVAFFLVIVATFDIVNLNFLPFSSEAFLLIQVSNFTQLNSLFNPLNYNNQVTEILCKTFNQVFKVQGFKGKIY